MLMNTTKVAKNKNLTKIELLSMILKKKRVLQKKFQGSTLEKMITMMANESGDVEQGEGHEGRSKTLVMSEGQ